MTRMKRRFRRATPARLLALVLAPVLAAAAACGGGGGGGSPTGPPPPQSGITFTASGNGTGISLVNGAGSGGNTLNLAVESSGIQDLYGVAFHLSYPYGVMHYTGSAQGTLLSAGGVATTFQIVEAPSGNLVVGVTRLGPVPGTSAAGTLLTLQFTAVASGSGTLAFSANQAVNSGGSAIPALSWNAGGVQVNLASSSSSAFHP